MCNTIITDYEIFIDGHKFSRNSKNDLYLANGYVSVNWNEFVTGEQYKGFNSVLKYDGDITLCDTSKVSADVVAITQDYSKAIEYASKCGDEYYAVMNLYSD